MYSHPDFFGFEGALDVAVLFAREDSVYKRLPGVDVFDLARDARTYHGPLPVVAHPPCRAWGRLRHFAKPRPDEKALALFAVHAVRSWGGVLEHPANSTLWPAAGLPAPGALDCFGGFTYPVSQQWFGHRAPKLTWLYVCGVQPRAIPVVPFELGTAAGRIARMGQREREATPEAFARWLVELARRCGVSSCSASTTATNSHKWDKARV